jgi:succinate dehydrogenase/fumarate reductase flavoprotein subunit
MEKHEFDVVVVGKGNAALCAALAAKDQGAP